MRDDERLCGQSAPSGSLTCGEGMGHSGMHKATAVTGGSMGWGNDGDTLGACLAAARRVNEEHLDAYDLARSGDGRARGALRSALEALDSRDAQLRALVEGWRALASEHGYSVGATYDDCAEELLELLGQVAVGKKS